MKHSKDYKAKKRFGQNFLKDNSVLDKIIESKPNNGCLTVEIGPGLGDLTQRLLSVGDVKAFEIDKDLFKILSEKFQTEIKDEKLDIVRADVLDIWSHKEENQESLVDCEYNLIANLPYYVATNIIIKALFDKNCRTIIVMIQKEVSNKFSAKAHDKEFSSLSVITSHYAKAIFEVCKVPPSSFEPAPKVDSSVLKIVKKDRDNQPVLEQDYLKFLRFAFSQPRKKLIKNLSNEYDKSSLQAIFEQLDITDNTRPHQLETTSYLNLYTLLKEEKGTINDKRDTRKQSD
jgi:16S rRNA (adenine1518-N6/adenine1519-N6)-dimethyltransferase